MTGVRLIHNQKMRMAKADIILTGRTRGGTYDVRGSGCTLRFIHLDTDKYQNLDTGEIYRCARDILLAHQKLHQGTGQIQNHPSYFTVTSGMDYGKKLSDL